jgi:hypothetical protein
VPLLIALMAGCGGGSKPTPATSTSTAAPASGPSTESYVARANAICRDALAETHAMGQRLLASRSGGDALALTTNGLVRPGIRIRERMAERMRKLALPAEGAGLFAAYVQLFDPLDSIARERLRAGKAGQEARAHDLETLLVELGDEQKAAAQRAGLHTCAKDFFTAALGGTAGG